jgi:hypothetical protein
MTQAVASYSVKRWHRTAWHGTVATGAKLFRLEMIHHDEGDIQGEGTVQHLVAQNAQHEVNFVALEQVIGSLGSRAGSFALQRIGTFEHGRVKETVTVLPGSGTGELLGLSGQALLEHKQHLERYPMILQYALSAP